jgi:hypothetical protein
MLKLQTSPFLKCLLFIVTISVCSCGYVSDKSPQGAEVYRSSELQSCKIDIEQLSQIFKSIQKPQILCIQENFIQYIKYIRNSSQNSISESELIEFVNKMYPNQNESISKSLKVLFDLNMILLGDPKGHISKENIIPLFDFINILNVEAVNINQILSDMKADELADHYWQNRDHLRSSTERFSSAAAQIIESSQDKLNQQVNIKQFILDMTNNLGVKNLNLEVIDSLLFAKKLLVSGEKENISRYELKYLFSKLPQVLMQVYDLQYSNKTHFNNDEEFARFKLQNVQSLYHLLQFNQSNFSLLTIDQLLNTLSTITKNSNINNFKISIVSLKSKLLNNSSDSITLSDTKKFLDLYNEYTEKNYFNTVTYNAYNDIMKTHQPILSLEQLDMPDRYDLLSAKRVKELHLDFNETAVKTRYYREEQEGIPYIGSEIRRNKYGFLQTQTTSFIIDKLLKAYGHQDQDTHYQLNVDEFKIFLSEMEPVLRELKLWSPDKSFAQNTILMADLFQTNSNGDLLLTTTEGTEYAQLAFSATELAKKAGEKLTPVCDIGENSKDPTIETQCYNDNFFSLILNELNEKQYFPSLNKYIESSTLQEMKEYLESVESFARETPMSAPINLRESSLIIGSMLNIESTFMRFDKNNDNIIDFNELDDAFNIYKNMIISIAKLKPNQEVYAKSVFLYMVTKSKPPPSGSWLKSAQFFAYHKCVSSDTCRKIFMKKIEAKRINIGELLSYVAKSKKSGENSNETLNESEIPAE